MKIFISWSGKKSGEAASALKIWLHDVIQTAYPWMSEAIPAGARWQNEIALKIQQADFGIICLTITNQVSPWLLFEAGALAKAISGSNLYVCPYLIDIDPDKVTDPIRQFQAKRADKYGTWQLIKTINEAMKDTPLSESELQRSFDRCWPDLKKVLDELPSDEPTPDARSGIDFMTEKIISAHFKELEWRMDSIIDMFNRHRKSYLRGSGRRRPVSLKLRRHR